ncbi:hypothetical protein TNCV_433541 [Trichonephila clavipes]|nr:hypothetical protein TNCV_433541 [Trichonephila clavipes]
MLYPRSNHWEKLEEGRSVTSVAAEFELLTASFHDFGDIFQTTGTAIWGSVVVVHEEPHPQHDRYIVLQARKKQGGRQRGEIASYTHRHRRLTTDIAFLPWPEDRTVVVCLHDAPVRCGTFNACPSEKAFSVVPGTPELERQ